VRRRRSDIGAQFSLSFLDCVCCGFGAIILLLVLTKIGEPGALEQTLVDLDGLVARLQAELFEIRGETQVLDRDLVSKKEQLSREKVRVASLQGDLSDLRGKFAASRDLSQVSEIIEGRLLAAQQELSEEMKRLQAHASVRPPPSSLVGGIPVDSEYVVFILDTSGSMRATWSLVREKMRQTLEIYPRVKGIQVMNDMGQYMFSEYAGKWIPDTAGRRRVILGRLAGWTPFSNSSPVEGITRAIRAFAVPDRKISLYVFGDEFTGSSIDEVVQTVRRLNRRPGGGQHVRIHAIGFPVPFIRSDMREFTGIRFATLMRALCRENGGTFVALNTIKP